MLIITIFNLILIASSVYSGVSKTERMMVIKNEIPYGEMGTGVIVRGSKVTALLQVESLSLKRLNVNYELKIPWCLKPIKIPSEMKLIRAKDSFFLLTSFELVTTRDKWFDTLELFIPDNVPLGKYRISSWANFKDEKVGHIRIKQDNVIEVIDAGRIKDFVKISEVIIPTNEEGKEEGRHKQNTILVRSKGNLLKLLLGKEEKPSEPTSYMSVKLKNDLESDLNVILRLDFLDPLTGKKVDGFEPLLLPEHERILPEKEGVYQLLRLQARTEIKTVLPIFAEKSITLPGDYLSSIRVELFGTDLILDERKIPIEVVSSRLVPTMVTFAAILISLSTFMGIYLKRDMILKMKTRDLITIALFGAIIFVTVSLPGNILWRFAHVLLGPFSFLITGFFYEIINYILLTALIVLIPRPGVATLAIILKSLMNDLFFGGLSATSLLNIGVSAILLEAAFYLAGITKGNRELRNKQILIAMLTCGLADTVIGFVSLNLYMLLYRLYYATWFITMYLIIGGFIYTAIAVPFGFKLGKRLRMVVGE
jgi:hypothetical protein